MILFGLLHIAISSLLAYGLSALFGQLSQWISILSLTVSVVLTVVLLDYDSVDFVNLRLGAWRQSIPGLLEKLVFGYVVFVGLRHFLFLFYQIENEIRTLHPYNLGDLPLHVQYIRNLAAGVDFPPKNPNFSTEMLRYPFGIDLYNALWECIGVPMSGHLFMVGMFCVLASLACLRLAGGWLAMVALFFSGGFIAMTRASPQEVQALLAWKNLFLSMFITQRGFIWALPVGVLIIYFLVLGARRKPELPVHPRTRLIMGILWASLAFFHLHTFFVLSLMIFLSKAYDFLLRKLKWSEIPSTIKKYFFVWIWPFTVGSFFVLLSLDFFKAPSVMHWHWGWTIEPGQNFFSYLSVNFGAYLLLFGGVGFYLFRHHLKSLYFEFILNAFLFAFFFNLMLAPWGWDNIKILVWPYLGLAILSYEVLRKHWTALTQVLLLLSLSYGGLYALWEPQFSLAQHITIYSTGDVAKAKAATQDLPINAVFAAGTTYNHELTALGRSRAMGYEGHLWGHGISYAETKRKLLALMEGSEHWLEMAHDLKVNYIYWGPRERQEFAATSKEPAWKSQLKNVSRVKDYEIYEVP